MQAGTMRGRRTTLAVVGVAVTALMGWAGAAFACSAQPRVYSLSTESAAPGETVVVRGERVVGEVEIRWNSVRGERLALATAGSSHFEVPVQIPEAAPGIYSLMLVTENEGVARTAIEVLAPAGSAPAPARTAALWPAATSAPAVSSGADVNAIGVALLAVGLIGLFGGTTVAVTRRRRALAGAQH